MRIFYLSMCAALILTFTGCGSIPPAGNSDEVRSGANEGISEVSLKIQTGMLGFTYTTTFRSDGKASCECVFYNLDRDNQPSLQYASPVCKELYQSNPSAFVRTPKSGGDFHLQGTFNGSVSPEEFGRLAQLIERNGFYSLGDRYVEEGRTDSPPDLTRVVDKTGKVKEVYDKGGKGGEKLSEIKSRIHELTMKTNWK